MKNKKGFTLLEILIAATIVGALAVLATVAYKNSVTETHMQAAKMRTEALARAVQRFRIDYPANRLSGEAVEFLHADAVVACDTSVTNVYSLFNCGYLENDGGWSDSYVQYFVCNGYTTAGTACANSKLGSGTANAPLACMTGRNWGKVSDKYKGTYAYCVNATSQGD